MYKFVDFLRQIRSESDLTQRELAEALNVSHVLVGMIESGQRKASKEFIAALASRLDVSEFSLRPLVDEEWFSKVEYLSGVEAKIAQLTSRWQQETIKRKAKLLRKYVGANLSKNSD